MKSLTAVLICMFSFVVIGQETAASAEAKQSVDVPEIPAGPNDEGVVREILDANGMAAKPLDSVATFAGGRVVVLDLSNKDFGQKGITKLPASIGTLTATRELYLNDNDLITLPAEIGGMTALTKLELNNNTLIELPVSLGNLSNLRELDLRNNELRDLPIEIGLLSSLWKLQLWGNDLNDLPHTIGNLKNLRELYLRGNRLKTLPKSMLKLKLSYLGIQDNRLCNLEPWLDVYLKKHDDRYRSWQKCW